MFNEIILAMIGNLQLLNLKKTYLVRMRFVYPTTVVKYHAYHEIYLMDL